MQKKCPACGYEVTAETQAALESSGSDLCLNCGHEFAEQESETDRYVRLYLKRFFSSGLTFQTGKYWMAAVLALIALALTLAENR